MTKQEMIDNITTLFGCQASYTYQMKEFANGHSAECCRFLYQSLLNIRYSELNREMKKLQHDIDEIEMMKY